MKKIKTTIRTAPRHSSNVVSRKNIDGTVAVMHLDAEDHFFTMDGVTAHVWLLIDGKTPWDKIKNKLIQKYNPPVKKFETDFKNLVSKLSKENLIEA